MPGVASGSLGHFSFPVLLRDCMIALARRYRDAGLTSRDAATRAAQETGAPRRQIYQALIKEKE